MIRLKPHSIYFFFILLALSSITRAEKSVGFAIASSSPYATKVGEEVLSMGGNAFDAIVAMSAAIGVVEPYHSGLGGGGFFLLRHGKSGQFDIIDAREVAPAKAHQQMYRGQSGASLTGPLAAAIPGMPAAFEYISNHYGKLGLAENLQGAIHLAREGFVAGKEYVRYVNRQAKRLSKYSASKRIFLMNKNAISIGQKILQPELASTLSSLATSGRDGFYKGSVAKQLVNDVNQAGGIWALDDLENYQVKIRKPLIGQFKNAKIITMPPPSAGGAIILMVLNMLEPLGFEGVFELPKLHFFIEAMKIAYHKRALYFGDPDHITIPLAQLLDKQAAASWRQRMSDKAIDSRDLPSPNAISKEGRQTTHICVLDKDGNAVSATLTVNGPFGSAFTSKQTGLLLNNEMDDFSQEVGQPNLYGLVSTKANAIMPGKRPLSSMSPTMIEKDGELLILGTPGGSRIPTMTLISILAYLNGSRVEEIVSHRRFHHQYLPDVVQYEEGALTPYVKESLGKRLHRLKRIKRYFGDMQVIRRLQNGNLVAASDPRGNGTVAIHNGSH